MGDKTPPLHGGVAWDTHPIPRGNEVVAVLREENGTEHGLCIGDNCIGRGPDAHVVLNRYGMSKRHAVITIPEPKASYFRLTDCGSTNGTQILLADKNRIHLLPQSTVQATWGTRIVFPGMCAVVRKSNVETIVLSDSEEVGSPLVLDEDSTDDEGTDDGSGKPSSPPRQAPTDDAAANHPRDVKVEAHEEKEDEVPRQDESEDAQPPTNQKADADAGEMPPSNNAEDGERLANEIKEEERIANEKAEGERLANHNGHEDGSADGEPDNENAGQPTEELLKEANDRPTGSKIRDNDGFFAPDPVSRPIKKQQPEAKRGDGNKEETREEKNEGEEDLPWTDDIDYTATQMFDQESRYWVRDGTQSEDFLSTQQERVWDGLDELLEEVKEDEDETKEGDEKEDEKKEVHGKEDEKKAEDGKEEEKKEGDGKEEKEERKDKEGEKAEGNEGGECEKKEAEAKGNKNEKPNKEKEVGEEERPGSPAKKTTENENEVAGEKEDEEEKKENETGNSDSWDMPWIDGPSQMVDDDISMYAADRHRWEATQMGETQCGWGGDLNDLVGEKNEEECEVKGGEEAEKEAEGVEKTEGTKGGENEGNGKNVEQEGGLGAVEAKKEGGDVRENEEEKGEGVDVKGEENELKGEKEERVGGNEKKNGYDDGDLNEGKGKMNDKIEGEETEEEEPEMIPGTPMGVDAENNEGGGKEGENEGGEDEKEGCREEKAKSGEGEKEAGGIERNEEEFKEVNRKMNGRMSEEKMGGDFAEPGVEVNHEKKEGPEENSKKKEARIEEEAAGNDTPLAETGEVKEGERENKGVSPPKKPSKGGRGRKKATPLAKITNRYAPLIPDQPETTTSPKAPNHVEKNEFDLQSKPRIIPRFYAKSRLAEPPPTPGTPPRATPNQSDLSTPASAQSNTQSNPPSAASSPLVTNGDADGGEVGFKREPEISTEGEGKGSRGRPKKRQKTVSVPSTPGPTPPDQSLLMSTGSHNLRNVRIQSQDIGIMFTGIEPTKKEEAAAKKIEAKLVSEPSQCTYLVADEVKRTVKFLAGLCVCKYVVTRDWLEASAKLGKPVGPENGIERFFIRPANQKGFGIYEALQRAQTKKLLEGKSIYATPDLSMKLAQLQTIVECGGGVLLEKTPHTFDKDTIIISSVENRPHHAPLEELGYAIHTIELLLTGILKQELSLGEFFVDASPDTSKDFSTTNKRAAPALIKPQAKSKRQK